MVPNLTPYRQPQPTSLADNSPPLALARTKRGNHEDGKPTLKEIRREISHLGIRVFLRAAPAAAASPDPPLLVPAAWLLISPDATTPAAPGAKERSPRKPPPGLAARSNRASRPQREDSSPPPERADRGGEELPRQDLVA